MVEFRNLSELGYELTESLRAIKTNLQFLGDDIKTILFTSSAPNEGKSTVVFSLARSMATSGTKVLLIDADIRKSVLVGRLMAKNTEGRTILGLTHYLSGQNTMEEVLYETNVKGISIIFSGPSVVNPTEILEKKYFGKLLETVKDDYDYILIDSPPIGAAIDAAVLARHCDGVVLIVAQDMIHSRAIAATKKQMEATGVPILGAIMNKVDTKNSRYGGYYGSYYGSYYGDYYRQEDEKK